MIWPMYLSPIPMSLPLIPFIKLKDPHFPFLGSYTSIISISSLLIQLFRTGKCQKFTLVESKHVSLLMEVGRRREILVSNTKGLISHNNIDPLNISIFFF